MGVNLKVHPDELFEELLIAPRYRKLRHIALVSVVVLIGINNVGLEFPNYNWLWQVAISLMIFLPILVNIYILVPKLLFRNRPYVYITTIASIVVTAIVLNTFVQYNNVGLVNEIYAIEYGSLTKYVILQNLSTLISFSLIMAGTTSLLILQSWLRDRRRIAQLESASAQTELDMLKNQINPHFLFNMLNNAMVLVREDREQAREVILKLREMTGYQLEKSYAEKVSLAEDINFLDGLLQLESLRRDSFRYYIMVDGDTADIMVPPLLFIPFVENAVKHGNDNTGESYIMLIFRVAGGRLDFFCTNSVPTHSAPGREGGIGLRNIRRRLELIYGKEHVLDISGTSKTYNINLNIGI